MVYKILRVLANIAIRIFYGKIIVQGLENVPKDGPLLIASNHPNGFLEPIIMACLFPRPLHFMVRGDVFNKKWLRPILLSTNQLPIFRFKDGFSALRQNDACLKAANDALDDDAAIILFIEGGTKDIKKLRPFQKGLSRMAHHYMTEGKKNKDIRVLPVGINFVAPSKWRSTVFLNVGESISAKDSFNDDDNPKEGILGLTKKLYGLIEPMVFHVDDDSKQDDLNQALSMKVRPIEQKFWPIVRKGDEWSSFKEVSNKINNGEKLESKMLPERSSILSKVFSLLLSPLGIIAFVFNLPPLIAVHKLVKSVLTEKSLVYIASIYVSGGVGIFVIYTLILFLLGLILGGYWVFLPLFVVPFLFIGVWWRHYAIRISNSK